MVVARIQRLNATFLLWPYPCAFELPDMEDAQSITGGLLSAPFYSWDSALFQKKSGRKKTMTLPSFLPSFAFPVLSLSTLFRDIADNRFSESAPVTVIDDNVDTEVSLRTFNKSDFVTTEIYVTVGEIIEPEHTLRDLNGLHAVRLWASIERNGYDYSRRLLSVLISSFTNNNEKSLRTIVQDAVKSGVLEEGYDVFLVNFRPRYVAMQQIAADVVAGWTVSSRIRAA